MTPELATVLRWPVTIIVIVLILGVIFRKPISDIISRIVKVHAKGVGFDVKAQEIVRETIDPDSVEPMMVKYNPVIKIIELNIDNMLKAKNISESPDVIKILKNHAAFWFLAFRYERIYAGIFGTQIALLHQLNSEQEGASIDQLEPFHDMSKSMGLKDYSLEEYIRYLMVHELMILEAEKYRITNLGKGFLHFLVEEGKQQNKLL